MSAGAFFVNSSGFVRFVEKLSAEKNQNSKNLETKCSSVAKRFNSLCVIALTRYTFNFQSVASFKV